MSVHSTIQPKAYIRVPHTPVVGRGKKLSRALRGCVLSPAYWLLAHRYRVPGLGFQAESARLAFRLLYGRTEHVSYTDIYRLIFWPMDSVRYFEFDFMWRSLSVVPFGSYLDVSSPRLFPVLLATSKSDVVATLINPDVDDLSSTLELVKSAGLQNRCKLLDCLVGAAPFSAASFDVITSMSVVEHILDDTQAVQKMWDLLKPKGRLLLTVPCAAHSSEEYQDRNEYGLLNRNEDGFFFFQRYYDRQLLQDRIFNVTGQPCRYAVYGEMRPGLYRQNMESKVSDPNYPFWREPYMMGKEYCYFKNLDELPGVGVIGMEFLKP